MKEDKVGEKEGKGKGKGLSPGDHLMCHYTIWTTITLGESKISNFQNSLFVHEQIVWFHVL